MNKKKIGYLLYGLISQLFRIFPMNKNKVVFYMVHNDGFQGNLRYIYDRMKREDPKKKFVIASKAELFSGSKLQKIKGVLFFYFGLNYHMCTAGQVFLNDNFLPLSYMHFSKKAKLIQMWHGVGAWKRFGLTTEKDEVTREAVKKGNQKITHLFVSSERIVPFYEEAMGISREKIYPVGLPVVDFYFDEERRKEAREHFYQSYPELKEKKIVLYTPTFRRTEKENRALCEQFDGKKIKEELGDEWAVLVRSHSSVQDLSWKLAEGSYNVTKYPNVKDLYEVADVLVNDYSSTMVEYALLQRPIVLFAYDFEKYDRGFYADYKENSPGPIVDDLQGVIKAVKKQEVDSKARERFLRLHYDYFDNKNTERVLEILEKEGEE